MDDRRQRLDRAVSRRDTLREEVQRVKGRLEAARAELDTVHEDCREKGLDPDKLDEALDALTGRYDDAVDDLESRIQQTEEGLKPYIGSIE